VRVRAQPFSNVTVLGGVFDDNPPGGSFYDDSQVRGAEQAGTKFNVKTGALFFAEVQYSINQPALGELDRGNSPKGLPGVYKLGGWYDTGFFPDQRLDDTGLSLADPNSSGNPKMRHGNFSIYGVFDQMIWRPDPDEARAIGIFARLMGAPGDRNLASFSVNGGIELKAPFKDRDDDTVGLGFGVAKVSPSAIKYDQDVNSFGTPNPVRSSETFVELTYQYAVAPWWQVQPDFQYVWTPGGGIANPLVPAKRIGNEAIFGVRTSIVF
jgi:porin